MNIRHLFITTLAASTMAFTAAAQTTADDDPEAITMSGFVDDIETTGTDDETAPDETDEQAAIDRAYLIETLITDSISIDSIASLLHRMDQMPVFEQRLLVEQIRLAHPLPIDNTIDVSATLKPRFYYLPPVFKPYDINLTPDYTITPAVTPLASATLPAVSRIETEQQRHDLMQRDLQAFCLQYPWAVRLNLESLPEPPKAYVATIDPKTAKIKVSELKVDLSEANKEIGERDIDRKNWLHTFNGSMQFSQAYVSPNWYQGGNNNLNLIGNLVWSVKLNPKFHPNLLFENTVQYKLAINSAPDDSLRSYSISEDRFQVNTKFGLKAANNWYYSATMQFKTQFLQNHPTNSRKLTAAFLSPGELNVGLGMTYDKTSANKKWTYNISLSPLSYNMICYRNTRVTAYKGDKVLNQYGSNIEAKITWKPVYYIKYTTRLYTFTDYKYLQGDWENTVAFEINRYLSTQIYVHLRYDSSKAPTEGTDWRYWQLKEILSFGFAYTFSTI